jgi:hypothetical protein
MPALSPIGIFPKRFGDFDPLRHKKQLWQRKDASRWAKVNRKLTDMTHWATII